MCRFREIVHRQRRAMAGERLLLTHFLFLPVQLVGCIPTSGCVWGGSFETTTSQFFLLLLGSRATQAVHSHWGGRHLHAILTPAHLGCCFKPNTAPLIFKQSWHDNTLCSSLFCLGVFWVSVHIFTYHCVFVISLPGKPQADWIGYASIFLSHPYFSSVSPFLPLVPLCIGTKGPPPLNGLTSLCSLCALSLLCWLFWKRFSVRCFIYLSICIYFWVLWKSIGLASFQTVACYSFWLCFEGWVGWWFSYEP